jgi:peptidoglycan hydrolase-like protein with peptidoglycan-binding domain
MAYSQNGYKANDRSLIATYRAGKASVKISMRKGDVSSVLLHFINWFDKNIQPIRQKDTGGYVERTIIGSKTISNHASGTAVDLRWNDHPLGKSGTFTDAQEKKIQTQLKFYDGVLRWGGNYSGRKDEMHFEINKNLAAVSAVARKIKGTPAPTPVKGQIPVDGQLGPKTYTKWQQVTHQTVNGRGTPTFIRWVQSYLRDRVDHRLAVDGNFGPNTIRALQRYMGSPVDGVISKPKSNLVIALQRRLNEGRF